LALWPSLPVNCYSDDEGANEPQAPNQLAKSIIDMATARSRTVIQTNPLPAIGIF
jgi:hypothetical protein